MTEATAAAAPEVAKEFRETECVYLGRRQMNDGLMAEAWATKRVLDGITDWNLVEAAVSHFTVDTKRKGPWKAPLVVGGVYSMSVHMEGDTIATARTSSREYLRQFDDEEAIARWRATDTVEQARDKARRQALKVKEEKALQGELDLLRARYHKLPHQDRLGFQLMVVNYISGRT